MCEIDCYGLAVWCLVWNIILLVLIVIVFIICMVKIYKIEDSIEILESKHNNLKNK